MAIKVLQRIIFAKQDSINKWNYKKNTWDNDFYGDNYDEPEDEFDWRNLEKITGWNTITDFQGEPLYFEDDHEAFYEIERSYGRLKSVLHNKFLDLDDQVFETESNWNRSTIYQFRFVEERRRHRPIYQDWFIDFEEAMEKWESTH